VKVNDKKDNEKKGMKDEMGSERKEKGRMGMKG
jgi:hypothetical protein